MTDSTPMVSVCVNTYKRPRLLGVLLDSLIAQEVDFRFEVVVVDNDKEESGRSPTEIRASRFESSRSSIHYLVEPVQNIAMARNRGVAAARGRLIALIDDDERAESGWLRALVETLNSSGVDGVFGPVLAEYPKGFPMWIQRANFLPRQRFSNGTSISYRYGRSGNGLLKRRLLGLRSGPFDPTYGLTGGEDSDLLAFLAEQGAKFAWADDAVVYEIQAADRADWRWYVRRSYRAGWGRMNRARSEKGVFRGIFPLLASTFPSFARLLLKSLREIRNPRALAVLIAMAFVNQVGKVGCLFGMRHEPYRN